MTERRAGHGKEGEVGPGKVAPALRPGAWARLEGAELMGDVTRLPLDGACGERVIVCAGRRS